MQDISLTRKMEAELLHEKILQCGKSAAESLLQMCEHLKKMRDERLYEELGFEEFGNYTESRLGIKQRMAYHYISTFEKLGAKFIEENAQLGITKLELLASLPLGEADRLVEENNLQEMNVSEVKALSEKVKGLGEQIELLNRELSEAKEEIENDDAILEQKDEKIKELQDKLLEMEDKLEAAEDKPTEVAVREMTSEQIAEIEAKAEEKLKAAHEKEMKKAVATARKEAQAEVSEKLKMLEAGKAESLEKLQRLEKQLEVSNNPQKTRFAFLFEQLQNTQNEIIEIIENSDEETSAKFKEALRQYLNAVNERIEK